MLDSVPNIILFCIFMGVWVLCAIRFVANLLAPVRTVKAKVVGKNTVESFSKTMANGKYIRYVVVFEVGGERLSFYVSEFSWNGYREGERGQLTYKGGRLLDFQ